MQKSGRIILVKMYFVLQFEHDLSMVDINFSNGCLDQKMIQKRNEQKKNLRIKKKNHSGIHGMGRL